MGRRKSLTLSVLPAAVLTLETPCQLSPAISAVPLASSGSAVLLLEVGQADTPSLTTEETISLVVPRALQKQARAKARAKKKPAMLKVVGLSLLQAASVNFGYGMLCMALVQEMEAWSGTPLPTHNVPSLSVMMTEYFDHLFFEGEESHLGEKILAAVLWLHPNLGKGSAKALPIVRQSLKGWRKLNPPRSRLPLPLLFVKAAAAMLAVTHGGLLALVTVLAFHLYLRPGVALMLCWEQLSPPSRKRKRGEVVGNAHRWSVNLHPREWELPSKTGVFDESVLIADVPEWEWLNDIMSLLQSRTRERALGSGRVRESLAGAQCTDFPRGTRVVEVTMELWSKAFAAACLQLGVPASNVIHLYRLRHGGASHDAAEKVRSLEEIQKRGGWRSFCSVARYSKPARLNAQINALSTVDVAAMEILAKDLPRRLRVALS
jgi:integrase